MSISITITITDDDLEEILQRLKSTKAAVATFQPAAKPGRKGRGNLRHATMVMQAQVKDERLRIMVEDGASEVWDLPPRSDLAGVRSVRNDAMQWAKLHGATPGQVAHVTKALTSAKYFVQKIDRLNA